ncbi:Long chain fatty acid elongase 2 [Caenorhabditis elegans]|uniref:Long chain fatty acid elongase 2 n=1 Tax=Caenorhabditis elegans TaxID=6239 RepID=ELO2_CAEEL|nr:Elongation of long chain fatty acids protein 2 [Caenorhabditis elegans]Q9XVQ9.1 RecName: Full=Long chain fatty acid elongase 2; Short=ELO-2; AltName: Full=Elongation of long chain fatty acids protein 2; AltName: Full=F11E6.5/ELO-2; AltName: Full=Long-chain 3-oxoacyl-CoA synthase 2; Short=CEELO2 [Caenorhabditis elegans]CAB02921.1 Elongation of long chain fatty acids protein 2 [Caenorhabditis elegans]|eukprot:NP_503114.1 Elongation of very long chain fatty acids protein [Caenorhabditis elegans]
MAAAQTSPAATLVDVLTKPWSLDQTDSYMSTFVPLSYKIMIGYLVTIYFGQKLMAHRKPFDLQNTLALWNFGFSLFSGIAAYKLIPELFGVFMKDGFVASYCQNENYYTDASTGFWGWAFVMSKAPELGDTMFLVLRKKPVIFMHWYHHALTFVYAVVTYSEHQAWARWSLALNLAVHTVMYFYFAVRALNIQTPRPVAKFITTIQIVQFVISCYIFGHLVFIKSADSVPGCAVSWNVLSIGGLMYISYLFLFAKFFYKAYIQKRSPTKTSKQE